MTETDKNNNTKKSRLFFRRGGLTSKLRVMTLIPIIVMGFFVVLCGFFFIKDSTQKEVERNLTNAANMAYLEYMHVYNGDMSVKKADNGDNRVYIGEFDITDDFSYLDEMKSVTGMEYTLFYGDVRVLTTVKDERGSRIVGSQVNQEVLPTVLDKKSPLFVDNANIYGHNYYALYMPVINSDGTVAGMICAGKPSADIEKESFFSSLKLIAVIAAMVVVAILFSASSSRDIIETVEKEKAYLNEIAKGNLRANLDTEILKRKDELGDMGRFTVHVQKYIRDMTERDTLTRLLTRRIGQARIATVQDQLEKQGVKYCVCMGDIDFFKKFNDTYGHDCGDQVLRETAGIFNENMVGRGFTIRWGGEEFLLIFEDSTLDKAYENLKKIREKVISNELIYDGQRLKITMTFGLVEGDSRDIEEIIKDADNMLYYGKQHGRNQIVTPSIAAESE